MLSVPDPDADGDGVAASADCDDANDAIFPGNSESCDGVDNDCDGVADASTEPFAGSTRGYRDGDGDGFGAGGEARWWCREADVAEVGGDCDDSRPDVLPGAAEVCNGVDDDCDGATDGADPDANTGPEAGGVFQYPDFDADGYGDGPGAWLCAGTAGVAPLQGDCAPFDEHTFPGAAEVEFPDACAQDRDGDGWADATAPRGVVMGTDCDDDDPGVHPGRADPPYDGIDEDCDPSREWDVDGDGWNRVGAPGGGSDCLDSDPRVFPGNPDLPGDGIDQDCSGVPDDCAVGTVACPAASCESVTATAAVDEVFKVAGVSGVVYDVPCRDDLDGGGWSLAATVANDLTDTWTFADVELWLDATTLVGDPARPGEDLRTGAFFDVPFRDLLFVYEPTQTWAAYHDVGSGRTSFGELSAARLLEDRCFLGRGHQLAAGTLTTIGGSGLYGLCSTDLYLHPLAVTGGTTCTREGAAIGPTWSAELLAPAFPLPCPFAQPGLASTMGVWDDAFAPDFEYPTLGFASVLNFPRPTTGVRHIKMYIR